MVEHIVLFRWSPGVSEQAVAETLQALEGMKTKVPGIVDLNCGEDFSGRSDGYHVCLRVRFTDRAALQAYEPHEAHQHVVQNFIRPICEKVLAFDFETAPLGNGTNAPE